ncbi:MAG: DUF4402 domain-containing protein [Sphingopyxis sp.]
MTSRFTSSCLALALGASLSTPAVASGGSAGSAAIILNPLSIVKTGDLEFGTLAHGTTAGTVTINPTTNARSATGGATLAGGAPQAATFVANGLANRLYIVALGTPASLTNGTGDVMGMTSLILDGPSFNLFGASGAATIRVGGILSVGANQAEGDYSGTFDVTLVYL